MINLGDNSKNTIAEVALKRIIEDGIDSLKLTVLAEDLGIARSTLYRFFNSKEEILFYVINKIFDKIETSYKCESVKIFPVSIRLKNIVNAIVTGVLEEKILLRALTVYWYKSKKNQKNIKEQLDRRFFIVHKLMYHLLLEGEKRGELFLQDVGMQTRIIVTMTTSLIIRSVLEIQSDPEKALLILANYIEGLNKNENISS